MKKTLLLSVVASTMIIAGGDIAPVEPLAVVEAPSGWDFSGQAVAYTQTVDQHGAGELFSGNTTYGALGLQLRAINKNLIGGLGVGLEVSGIGQNAGFSDIPAGIFAGPPVVAGMANPNRFAFPYFTGGDAQVDSAAVTQAYITYGIGNTSIKIGRQTLSKAISPFAFSEGWQVFKNTMEAALIVNNDIQDTKLIYAAIGRANASIGRLDNFQAMNPVNPRTTLTPNDGTNITHMGTIQNSSIPHVVLTGTYYFMPDADFNALGDLHTVWADAHWNYHGYMLAAQGGQISGGAVLNDTTAFGAMAGATMGRFSASVAYSSVDDGDIRIANFATVQSALPNFGIKSPLYTQMVLNNIGFHHATNSDWLKVAGSAKVLGGTVGLAWGMAVDNYTPTVGGAPKAMGDNPMEVDLTYKAKITKDITVFAAYVYTDRDRENPVSDPASDPAFNEDSNNFVRFWARYNF